MQGEEPSACLVYSFGYEVCRKTVVEAVRAFKRIMVLCIGHRPRVEPYIYKVLLAAHRLASVAHQYYLIDKGSVQVEGFVVLAAVVPGHECCKRIAFHMTCGHRFFNLLFQLFGRTNALYLCAVFGDPYRQRRAPVP